MATYEVTCELVVQRTVWVDAKHGVEAAFLARQEVSKSQGVGSQEIAVVSSRREGVDHPYQFDLWSECCGSTFEGEVYDGCGRCSSCKEMSGSYKEEGEGE
mgnify:FL=1